MASLMIKVLETKGEPTEKRAKCLVGNPAKTVPTDLRNDISRRLSKPCCSDATVTAMGTMVP